jgi:hypothetical protein
MSASTIQLDTAFCYTLAAASAVRRSLELTHGEAFADAFLKEHQNAFRRAVRTSLCGRDWYAVKHALESLKRSYRI